MELVYWIKFVNRREPDRWRRKSFEELWHDLREFMMVNNTGHIEWMIRD